MNEKEAVNTLRLAKNVLDKYGVIFWLECGTCLGAVRDSKFVPWDHDIDLGSWRENTAKICLAFHEIKNMGYKISFGREVVNIKKNDCSLSITLYHLNSNKAVLRWGNLRAPRWLRLFFDIFLWSVTASHYGNVKFKTAYNIKSFIGLCLGRVSCIMPFKIKKLAAKMELKWGADFFHVLPANFFLNLSTIRFYGMRFRVMRQIDEFLTYRYGENWKIPDNNWNPYIEIGDVDSYTILIDDGK